MIRKSSWLQWIRSYFSSQIAASGSRFRRRRVSRRNVRSTAVELLEQRVLLAATTFNSGALTIDFSATDEIVSLNNDGTNITVSSSAGGITGAGGSFTTNSVTRLVVTDSGDFTNQTLLIGGSTAYSLASGVDISGAEMVSQTIGINTATADLSIIANWQMFINAALSTTDGDIVLKANEQATSPNQSIGVDLFAGSAMSSGTGTVTIIGRGGVGTTNINVGVRVDNGGKVSGSSVSVTGFGGLTTFPVAYGVYVSGSGSLITSTGGAVVVDGTGGGTGSSTQNYGVFVSSGGSIIGNNGGALTVRGTGGNAGGTGSLNYGVFLSGSAARIVSTGGPVSITATGTSNSVALNLAATGQILSGGGPLTLTADSMTLAGVISSGTGTTALLPKSSGTLINLGGTDTLSGALRLGLTSTELNNILAGTLVVGSSTSGDITVSTAVSVPSVGQLELVTGGQMLDGNNSGTDLSVSRLGLTAVSGIGVGNALETAVGNLEATTATGGIFVANSGNLTIGGVNATLSGVQVTTSGAIDLQNTGGNVRITHAGEFILSSGNVNVSTVTSGDIITANNNGFNDFTGSVNSTGGTVTLNAAGNLDIGETGDSNVSGDIRSQGNLTLMAGGSITVDDGASVQTPTVGSTISITAGTDVSMLQTHTGGSLIGNASGNAGLISIRTGAGGTFTLQGGSSDPGLLGGSGGIVVLADDMSLLDDIRAFGGDVSLGTISSGRTIDLGTDTSGTLGLTNAEIRNVLTATSLNIGTSSSGSMTISSAIAPLIGTVNLVTGGSVVSTTASGNDITASNQLGITASTGIGASGKSLVIATSGLSTNTSGGNGAQYLAEADSVVVNALDLNAGTETITLTSGTFLTSTGGDILSNVVVGSGATLGGTGTINGDVSGPGNVSPGNSPGVITINGNFTPTGTLTFEVNPPAATPGVDYDQINVSGTVDLSGATIAPPTGTAGAVDANRVVTLIQNTSASPITPSASYADGAVISIGGNSYRLYYGGGTGNDLVLVENSTPVTVYVDGSFTGNPGQVIADADQGTNGNQAAVFGVTGFTTIAAALAAVSSSGTVIVNAGTYAETVSVTGTRNLQIGGTDAAQAVTVTSLATVAGTTLNLAGTSSLTFGDGTNVSVDGVITGGGSLTKQGAGIVKLAGDNSYSGTTTVSAGTLQITANNGLGTNAGGTTVASGAKLDLRNVNYSTSESVTLQSGTLTNSAGTTSFAGTVTMTAINCGFQTNSSVLILNGAVQGAFTLDKSGAGTLRLCNTANSFTRINIGGGTLQLGASGVIPDTADIVNSSAFDVNGFDESMDALSGNGVTVNLQATTATLTLGAGNNIGDSRYNGSVNGPINLVKTGTGRQTLGAGGSTYTGTTTINGGTLAVTTENGGQATKALGSVSAGTIVNAGAVLEFQFVDYAFAEPITVNGGTIRATAGGNNPVFGSSSFGGPITLSGDTASFNLTTAATLTLNGIIDGDQALTKTGVGTLILASTNSYSGNTTISGGTLLVNGSLTAASAVSVNNSGTLGGSGTVNGTVGVASGGTVSPGASSGILNTGSVSFSSGSTFVVEVNGTTAGVDSDQLNVTGSVSLGNATFTASGTITRTTGQIIVLINNDGADPVIGTFNGHGEKSSVLVNGQWYVLSYLGGDGNDVVLFANDPPVALASAVTTDEDTALSFTVSDFQFSDIQNDSMQSITISNLSLAAGDTLTVDQGAGAIAVTNGTTITPAQITSLHYTPLPNANGSARSTFDFAVNDVEVGTVSATMSINVVAANDAPVTDLNGATAGQDVTTGFIEQTPVLIAPSGTLSDIDSANLTSLTVTLTARPDGNAVESLSLNVAATTAASGLTVNYNAGTGVLTIIGSASVATYQTILQGILYSNISDTPTTTNRSVTFVANDGSDPSVTQTATLTVAAVNDAPVTDLNGATAGQDVTTAFIEQTPVLIAPAGTLSDLDSASLASLTATLTARPDGNAVESLSLNVAATTAASGLAVNYNAGTGVLTIIGSASVATYQTILQGILYNNASDTPTTTNRSVTFVANDGSAPSATQTATITVAAVNDAPVTDLNGATAGQDVTTAFIEQTPVLIAPAGTLSDIDSANLASLTATLTARPDGNAVESLSLNAAATTAASGLAVNYNASTGVLTIIGSASVARYQSILQGILYNNTNDAPTTTNRSVTFVANDGSAPSATQTATITVAAVNDAPVTDLNGATAGQDVTTAFIEQTPVLIAPAGTLSDLDSANLTSLTATLTARPDGNTVESLSLNAAATTAASGLAVNYNAGTGVLTIIGSASVATYQTILQGILYSNTSDAPTTTNRSVTFVANDGSDPSATQTATITVAAVNDAPVTDLNGATAGQDVTTGFIEQIPVLIAPAGTLSDIDSANLASLTATLTARPDGNTVESLSLNAAATTAASGLAVNYNASTGVLTIIGSASVARYQSILQGILYNNTSQTPNTSNRSVTFVANDGSDPSVTATATITVTALNDAPTNLAVTTTTLLENNLPGAAVGTFIPTDPDTGDHFTYTFVNGPGDTDNVRFTISGNLLRIIPATDFEVQNSYSIRVRVADQAGLSFDRSFTISVKDVKEAPTDLFLSNATIQENTAARTTVGFLTATDPDAGAVFTYRMNFGAGSADNAKFIIVGNQLQIKAGADFETQRTYSIRVLVQDQTGLSIEKTFTILVQDVNEAPVDIGLIPTGNSLNNTAGAPIGTLTASDPDAANTFTFALVSGLGSSDNDKFTIVGNTVMLTAPLDFSRGKTYSFRVRVTDQSGQSFENRFRISSSRFDDLDVIPGIRATARSKRR